MGGRFRSPGAAVGRRRFRPRTGRNGGLHTGEDGSCPTGMSRLPRGNFGGGGVPAQVAAGPRRRVTRSTSGGTPKRSGIAPTPMPRET